MIYDSQNHAIDHDAIIEGAVKVMKSWDEITLDEMRIRYSEYRNAMGPDATESFNAFCLRIATQNFLYQVAAH